MADKIATTFTIDKEVKMAFKIECVKNGVEMGETVQKMMADYVSLSREIHDNNQRLQDEKRI